MAKKKITPKGIFNLLKTSFNGFLDDKVVKLSAALAYYTVFSLPSMLIVIIGVCGIFYGRDEITGEIFNDLSGFIGKDTARQLE